MANSTFPIKFGWANGWGRRIVDRIVAGTGSRSTFMPVFAWHPGRAIGHADLTEADGSQAVNLNTIAGSKNEFPSNVIVLGGWLELDEVVAGGSISAATASLGDAGAPTEILNAVNVFTGATLGLAQTNGALPGAGPKLETAYEPLLTIATTSDDVADATTGAIWPVILYMPMGLISA